MSATHKPGAHFSGLATGRLRGIDALRGAAALGVVVYHAVTQAPYAASAGFSHWLALPVRAVAGYGYTGVFLFFVISGFCIHLHWAKARAAGAPPQIAFGSFWQRRLWRLYPPYLLALALYLGVQAFTSDQPFTRFDLYDTGLHLAMLHNFDPRTVYSINGVFWTLAIEEQLYLAYFLLLFIRRRWGWGYTLLACAAARVAWLALAIELRGYDINVPVTEAAAVHWLTWALGALSVEAALGLVSLPRWCRNLWLALAALLAAGGLAYVLDVVKPTGSIHHCVWLLLHPAWGLGFFIVVNRVVAAERGWRARLTWPRLWRWGAAVGIFSYSLYLTHQLIMLTMWRFTRLGLPGLLVALLIMTPLSVLAAWLFYRCCERPFLPSRSTRTVEVSPTPAGAPVSA